MQSQITADGPDPSSPVSMAASARPRSFHTASMDAAEDMPRPKQSIFGKVKRMLMRRHSVSQESNYICQDSRIRVASEGMDASIIDLF
jgi:hypothetical protein